MRTFIALDIPEKIKERIYSSFAEDRKRISGLKWVNKENLHITLKFLGEVKEEKIPEIVEILEEVSQKFKSFEVTLKEVGGFPNLRTPRVLWVGVKPEEKFREIFEFIESRLHKRGFEREKRDFHPHITVGRLKRRGKVELRIKNLNDNFIIKKLILFKSDLKPEGPIYTPLKEVELKNG